MHCPRLDHFIKLAPYGKLTRCCHMTSPPQYNSLTEMENSTWLKHVKQQLKDGVWPEECVRCKNSEEIIQPSVREMAIKFHEGKPEDYLQVDVILDNICNSACQFCSGVLSTRFASLTNQKYSIYSSVDKFWELPTDRIIQIDLSGGEPSASQNCSTLLSALPKNVKSIRINTNGSMIMPEVRQLIDKGIEVTLTVSVDGIGKVQDYIRWPITWNKLVKNLMLYQETDKLLLNLYTTVNALNIGDLPNITEFAKNHNFNHAFAFLKQPLELDVYYQNRLTLAAKASMADTNLTNLVAVGPNNDRELASFVAKQDALRNISINDYIHF